MKGGERGLIGMKGDKIGCKRMKLNEKDVS